MYDVTVESVPAEYGSMTMYKECGHQSIGSRSSHQVVTLSSANDISTDTGAFGLNDFLSYRDHDRCINAQKICRDNSLGDSA